MLLADARIDFAKTFTGLLDDQILAALAAEFQAMEREAADALKREFGASDIFYERYAEMRYRGQRHNIKVPITGLNDATAIHGAFTRDYKRRYGHADSKAPAEIQALLVSGFAKLRRPDIARLPRRAGKGRAANARPVYFGKEHGTLATQVYERDALPLGFEGAGPAVIEEYGSTTLVAPGDRFGIGTMGEIRIHCGGK
jgi:N-methylhydantoinase A